MLPDKIIGAVDVGWGKIEKMSLKLDFKKFVRRVFAVSVCFFDIFCFLTQFLLSSHMYPQNPEGTVPS